jgi:large subunit ribosomal protein L24
MDKLVTRVRQAERHATRNAAFLDKLKAKRDRKERLQSFRDHHKQVHENWVTTRESIRQQWALGPLAPKVDLGNGEYGTLQPSRANPETQLPEPFVKERCAWAGGIKRLCLVPGDRVIILQGPDNGRIDQIEDIDMRNGTITLKNLHRIDMMIPAWLKKVREKLRAKNPDITAPGATRDRASRAASIPISAVRLVHPLKDPKTGKYRDVMIQELRPTAVDFHNPLAARPSYNQWEYGKRYDRIVPGINVCIPWPEPEAPDNETYSSDTRGNVLLERTFVPTLLRAPMPPQVLDELRGRYSKFRTRHEPWYIAKKEAEAAEKKLVHSTISEMRTPLMDFHRAQKEIRKARGQPELTDDMLEAIGRIMERNAVDYATIGADQARKREEVMANALVRPEAEVIEAVGAAEASSTQLPPS